MRNIVKKIIAVVQNPNPETLEQLSQISLRIFHLQFANRDPSHSTHYRQRMGTIARVIHIIETAAQKPNSHQREDPAFQICYDLCCAETEEDNLEPEHDTWLLDLIEKADPVGYGHLRLVFRLAYRRAQLRQLRIDAISEATIELLLKKELDEESELIIMSRIISNDKQVIRAVGRVLGRRASLRPNFSRIVELYSRAHVTATPQA